MRAIQESHIHTFEPVFDKNSKVLILGTFPSRKSRESAFYYGHPNNRFWKVLSAVYKDNVPETVSDKKDFLLRHGVALWDVVYKCNIIGSSDNSIKDVVPNNINVILSHCDIRAIFANGQTAEKLYNKYILGTSGIKIIGLPSTSPANAAWNMDRLTSAWSVILNI